MPTMSQCRAESFSQESQMMAGKTGHIHITPPVHVLLLRTQILSWRDSLYLGGTREGPTEEVKMGPTSKLGLHF